MHSDKNLEIPTSALNLPEIFFGAYRTAYLQHGTVVIYIVVSQYEPDTLSIRYKSGVEAAGICFISVGDLWNRKRVQ